MNTSLHVFLCVCVLLINYAFMWYGKGDQSLLMYTNIAVFVSLGLVSVTEGLAAIWKK